MILNNIKRFNLLGSVEGCYSSIIIFRGEPTVNPNWYSYIVFAGKLPNVFSILKDLDNI